MKKVLTITVDIDDANQEQKYGDCLFKLMKELEKNYNAEPVKNKVSWTIEDKTV